MKKLNFKLALLAIFGFIFDIAVILTAYFHPTIGDFTMNPVYPALVAAGALICILFIFMLSGKQMNKLVISNVKEREKLVDLSLELISSASAMEKQLGSVQKYKMKEEIDAAKELVGDISNITIVNGPMKSKFVKYQEKLEAISVRMKEIVEADEKELIGESEQEL